MKTIANLINHLEEKGIHLWVESQKLRYKAAKEAMTPDVMAELKANKEELIQFLEQESKQEKFVIDRQNRFEPFPLTDVQSAYLVGRSNLFEYGGVACHVYLELKYKELETTKVTEIWNKLVHKYDMLHAIINEGGFQQVMSKIPVLEIPEWDLKAQPELSEKYEQFAKEMGNRSYTVGKWPMFGLAVSKHADYCILHFSIEFLLADWTSIWKLVTEFEGAYFDGKEIESEEELSFRDYLVAEKKVKSSAQYEKEKSYWMKRIPNLPEAPDLPKLPISNCKNSFNRKFLRLNAENWNRIKERSKQYGLTPTIPVLVSYADVLSKWSGSKHFCINLTVLNRLPLHEKVMEIVGDFTSLSLLEINKQESNGFLEMARKTNAVLFEDLDNRLFSGVEVMREISRLQKKSGLSMPIVYTSAIGLSDSSTSLRGEFVGGISQTPQTFIDCQVMDGSFGLQVNWDYREGVFEERIISEMFNAFEKRLTTLANNDDWNTIPEIGIPLADMQERIEANNTKHDWNIRMLQDDFIKNAETNPDKIAIDDGEIKLTYGEVHARAKAVAQILKDKGVQPQECVPILMEKSAWQVVAVFGILYARAIYVPIAAQHAMGRTQKIIAKTGCKVVLSRSSEQHEEANGLTLINVDTVEPTNANVNIANGKPNDIAYIIYTSGSTGEPKGVVITHKGAMNTIDDMNIRFNVTKDDNVLGLSQLNFDLSVYDIFGILGAGGTVYYPHASQYMNPEYWEKLIREKNITTWNSVPALMKILMNYMESQNNPKPLPIKKAFLSGDWIPLDMPDQIQKFSPDANVVCLGGATEASIWSNYHVYDKNDGLKILPYGKPLANQTMHILDDDLNPCPTMVAGQIALGGDGVALGYYKDEERTDAQFVDLKSGEHVYLTGDIGRYLPGGEIEFLGRKDNQVKIRGHRIELGEIENVFRDNPQVRNAVAVVPADKSEINVMFEPGQLSPEATAKNKEAFEKKTFAVESAVKPSFDSLNWEHLETAFRTEEKAAAYSILLALQKLGFFVANKEYTTEEIAAKVPEKYRWHAGEWLRVMIANQLVSRSGEKFSTNVTTDEKELKALWDNAQNNWDEEIGSKIFIDSLRLFGEHFEKFLNGTEDPLLLLSNMDSSTSDINKSSFENWAKVVQSWNASNKMSAFIKSFLQKISDEKTKRTLKILELGAGAGQLTHQIIPFLQKSNISFEYLFTDYQAKFFPAAQEKYSDVPGFATKRIDINQSFIEQGLEPNSFDIVIAAEVLDNATEITTSLKQIKEILKPQSYAFIMEPYGECGWLSIFQTLPMDKPQDSLREDSTFLPKEKWIQLLDATDEVESTKVFPANPLQGEVFSCNLFVKQFKLDRNEIDEAQMKTYIDNYLLNYMHPAHIEIVDKLPLSANGKIDRKAVSEQMEIRKKFSNKTQKTALPENENEQKIQKICEKIIEVSKIEVNDNLYEYGANSILMTQIVSTLRKDLNVSVSFDVLLKQMLDYPTIRETAEFLFKDEENSATSESVTDGFLRLHRYGKPKEGYLRVILPAIFWNADKFQNLIPYLEEQDEGEIYLFGMADQDKFCKLHPKEVGSVLAEQFTRAILENGAKHVQLICYCYISPVGIEMAQRLIAKGIEITRFECIDGSRLGFHCETSFIRKIFFAQMLAVDLNRWGLDPFELVNVLQNVTKETNIQTLTDEYLLKASTKIKNGEKLREFLALSDTELVKLCLEYSTGFAKNAEESTIARLYALFNQSMNIMLDYTPVPFYGDIRYYKAYNSDGLYQFFDILFHEWDRLCLGNLEIVPVPGNHVTCVTDPNHAKVIAEHLRLNKEKA